MKQALILKFWVIFGKVMNVYSLKIAKKTHQKSSFWCHSRYCNHLNDCWGAKLIFYLSEEVLTEGWGRGGGTHLSQGAH